MIVRYEIEYWDDIEQEIKIERGIAGASESDTIGVVVDRIYDYYGKENVTSIRVYECENILVDDEIRDMLNA